MATNADPFGARDVLATPSGDAVVHLLPRLEEANVGEVGTLPYSIRVLLESLLRNLGGPNVAREDVEALARWEPGSTRRGEVPFIPSRILLQDFTGVPVVVDLAAMRAAVSRMGGDPGLITPVVPVDLVIDHSVQVDAFATPDARRINEAKEYERNGERYAVLRWAQGAFEGFRVAPPGKGIVHQVNLEHLASVVQLRRQAGELLAFPDTLVGTDSHTPMVNGLGVLGWGVGGIEAEAVMLGQPYHMPAPEVVGFRLRGRLGEGVTATDMVLTITRMLRSHGVVGRFVEFFGPGVTTLSVQDRATVSNMSPEYGATVGYFPVDEQALRYLLDTGRSKEHVDLVRRYLDAQGLLRTEGSREVRYTEVLELDLGEVVTTLAGPKRPQDSIALGGMPLAFRRAFGERGGTPPASSGHGDATALADGDVVIAAITSCTNTSNPDVMVAAGLLAKRAVERGLRSRPHVKTSLAPGSRVVTDYLEAAGLIPHLERLGFHVVGYGCTTCIGNSGPLPEAVAREVADRDLAVAAVLSGNRNFEGRIHPLVRANYLASPPLVVAYAIAGRVDIDLEREPLGTGADGRAVHLREIWPTNEEVARVVAEHLRPEMYAQRYSEVMAGTDLWDSLDVPEGGLYAWDPASTYLREPPFFEDLSPGGRRVGDVRGARVLALLGDTITTDHISPAGAIAEKSPAGEYLVSRGVTPAEFNTYGSRRGNHEVMMRGTFANVRLRNRMAPGTEGGWTRHLPSGDVMTIHAAAMRYRAEGVPLLVVAGAEYGSGSSRDWAAKGTQLLGVRAVIARSFERIHRSNLVGMGVLPLRFKEGEGAESMGLTGEESYDIVGMDKLAPGGELRAVARAPDGTAREFSVDVLLNSQNELLNWSSGGILNRFIIERVAGGGK